MRAGNEEGGRQAFTPLPLAVLALLFCVGAGVWWHLSAPDADPADPAMPVLTPEVPPSRPGGASEVGASDAEVKMRAAYAELEGRRQTLQRRLSRLRHEISGRHLPARRAEAIRARMMAGTNLLRAPRLLGGFRDARQIKTQIHRIDYIGGELDQVELWLKEDGE